MTDAQPKTARGRLEAAFDWMEAAIFALVGVALVFTFLFRVVGVDGRSMESTLLHNDRLILQTNFYTPARGDIVVINRTNGEPLIKRILALPGDSIDIDEAGRVVLNGEILGEPYLDPAMLEEGSKTPRFDFEGPLSIPAGYAFVMGDHRTVSKDSRSLEIGLVRLQDIAGKAVFRIWPPTAIGGIY